MLGMTADLGTGLVTVKHTAELSGERLAQLVTGVGYPAKVAAAGEAGAVPANPGNAGGYGCGRGCGPRGCAFTAPPPGQG
jgi:hypothetical protein